MLKSVWQLKKSSMLIFILTVKMIKKIGPFEWIISDITLIPLLFHLAFDLHARSIYKN